MFHFYIYYARRFRYQLNFSTGLHGSKTRLCLFLFCIFFFFRRPVKILAGQAKMWTYLVLSSIVRYETNSGTTELVFFFSFTITICPYTHKQTTKHRHKSTGGGMDKWMCMRLLRPVLMGSAFVRLFVCLCIEWHTSTEEGRCSAGVSIIKRTQTAAIAQSKRTLVFFFVCFFTQSQ